LKLYLQLVYRQSENLLEFPAGPHPKSLSLRARDFKSQTRLLLPFALRGFWESIFLRFYLTPGPSPIKLERKVLLKSPRHRVERGFRGEDKSFQKHSEGEPNGVRTGLGDEGYHQILKRFLNIYRILAL
jgi:hypothetical protein